MNRVAIAFSTKDRYELSRQTMRPLVQQSDFDLFWVDGSDDYEAEQLPYKDQWGCKGIYSNVRGGADTAIVFSLTTMLAHPNNYTHVGLVENDVLLHTDWFAPTMALFERGKAEGLKVGAVSARCYEDRILCQRDGFALCHNLGAGCIILTRKAAEYVLANFRTGWWSENRRTFMQLSGLDIGRWGAFRTNEQWVTADWHFEETLAQFGLASLALTPSPVEMIGQVSSLHEQGLKLVTEPVELLRNDVAFSTFVDRTRAIREKNLNLGANNTHFHQADDGSWTIFPHQIADIGGKFSGDWKLRWHQGYGPFAWEAGWDGKSNLGQKFSENISTLTVPVSGSCSFLVSGGENGGQVEVEDLHSGYKVSPILPGNMQQALNLVVPGGVTYREIRLTMRAPGTIFYGLATKESQPWLPGEKFTHDRLPSA